MLRDGRTLRELVAVAEKVYGPLDTPLKRSNAVVQCLVVLHRDLRERHAGIIPAGERARILVAAREVVGGGK